MLSPRPTFPRRENLLKLIDSLNFSERDFAESDSEMDDEQTYHFDLSPISPAASQVQSVVHQHQRWSRSSSSSASSDPSDSSERGGAAGSVDELDGMVLESVDEETFVVEETVDLREALPVDIVHSVTEASRVDEMNRPAGGGSSTPSTPHSPSRESLEPERTLPDLESAPPVASPHVSLVINRAPAVAAPPVPDPVAVAPPAAELSIEKPGPFRDEEESADESDESVAPAAEQPQSQPQQKPPPSLVVPATAPLSDSDSDDEVAERKFALALQFSPSPAPPSQLPVAQQSESSAPLRGLEAAESSSQAKTSRAVTFTADESDDVPLTVRSLHELPVPFSTNETITQPQAGDEPSLEDDEEEEAQSSEESENSKPPQQKPAPRLVVPATVPLSDSDSDDDEVAARKFAVALQFSPSPAQPNQSPAPRPLVQPLPAVNSQKVKTVRKSKGKKKRLEHFHRSARDLLDANRDLLAKHPEGRVGPSSFPFSIPLDDSDSDIEA
jgi:hypothetical protein